MIINIIVTETKSFLIMRFIGLGLVVGLVFVASFGPFIYLV